MESLSGVGLAMSVIFGCLVVALLAELYYVLWWKRRITNARIEDGPAKEFFFMFCGKNPSSLNSNSMKPTTSSDNLVYEQPQNTDSCLNPLGEQSIEAELMRLSVCGPPRFLCTIKEETMEDLESRSGSLSDAVEALENQTPPFLTPIASPPYYTPPLSPLHHPAGNGADDIASSSSVIVMSRAEEEISLSEEDIPFKDEEENGSYITLVFPRNRDWELLQHYNNGAPLASSSSSPSFK